MKESSYHNTNMAVYCQEVCQLEDKFDGLELNHISRRLNEVGNALAKMASGREPMPMGVFANDQHKPLVRYEGSESADDQPSAPSGPKVIELEEDPATEPNPLVD